MLTDQYKGLFGSPNQAQSAFGNINYNRGSAPGYMDWRTGISQSGGWTPESTPNMIQSVNVPGWAQNESDTVRSNTPGAEFQEKSNSMMDYLKAVAEGRQSNAMDQANASANRASLEAKGRLAAGPWSSASQRAAGYAAGTAGMQIGAQGALAAAQEKQQAQQAYLQAQDAQRRQDVSIELAMEELARRYREMGMSDEQARAAALQQYAQDNLTHYGLYKQGKQQWEQNEANSSAAIAGLIGTGLGTLAGGLVGGPAGAAAGGALGGTAGKAIGSDKRLKSNIKSSDKDIGEFLNHISAKRWTWKDSGKQDVGIIAQDLEKSKIGRNLVETLPRTGGMKGYTADSKRFHPIVLASLASINKRLSNLEKK